jgi:hypothetical protein
LAKRSELVVPRDEEEGEGGTAPPVIIGAAAAAATAPEEEAAVDQDPGCALAPSRMPDSSAEAEADDADADADADAAAALLAARPLMNDVANGADEGCDALAICSPDTCMRPGER